MLYNVVVSSQVDAQLGYLVDTGQRILAEEIAWFLREVQENWPYSQSNVKNIGNNIYRKRLQRWRLLYTIDLSIITFWILDIEKDTQKDYARRKLYIKKQIKNRNI